MKRRSDGSFLGFAESFEGILCLVGWIVCYMTAVRAIAAGITAAFEWFSDCRKITKLIKDDDVKDISDNGPVDYLGEDYDFSKINHFQKMTEDLEKEGIL